MAKRWSQEQLATIAGLSTRTVQRIENGHAAGLETVKSLASAFETDVETLTRGNDMQHAANTDETHINEIKGFHLHLWVFAILAPLLLLLNLFVTGAPLWVQWVLVFWLLGLVLHAVTVRVMHGSLRLPGK